MSVTVLCTYRVREGAEADFEALLAAHVPTLRRLGLITDRPTTTAREVGDGPPTYIELFEWIDDDAAARASEVPDVIAVWEPMAALCEVRDGRPAMEFPHYRDV